MGLGLGSDDTPFEAASQDVLSDLEWSEQWATCGPPKDVLPKPCSLLDWLMIYDNSLSNKLEAEFRSANQQLLQHGDVKHKNEQKCVIVPAKRTIALTSDAEMYRISCA